MGFGCIPKPTFILGVNVWIKIKYDTQSFNQITVKPYINVVNDLILCLTAQILGSDATFKPVNLVLEDLYRNVKCSWTSFSAMC